ncbi:hypothetical protein PoB_000807000 [Plakobranchus ocellatus]|uniref:Uncharacterized protein n=1 Tax=Plakobranchus ocellatus TaxID=259542 RepID=A0AAV3YGE7_9GAST|nr:hypothetical protein PoB_000807000 [Plakobranchus ocellatus]
MLAVRFSRRYMPYNILIVRAGRLSISAGYFRFLYIASAQQGDLRLLGPPSGQGAVGGARTPNRRVPADLRADSLATVLPTPPGCLGRKQYL